MVGMRNRSIRRKPSPVPFCLPQNPHNLTRAPTLAAAVGSERLAACTLHEAINVFPSTLLGLCRYESLFAYLILTRCGTCTVLSAKQFDYRSLFTRLYNNLLTGTCCSGNCVSCYSNIQILYVQRTGRILTCWVSSMTHLMPTKYVLIGKLL
jgi:hypothetical protein